MLDKTCIEIENEILDHLAGKIFLLQEPAQKKEIVLQIVHKILELPRYKKFIDESKGLTLDSFLEQFLSYGIIEEFLADPDVEDIMINYLSPIFVHRTKSGLVKTDRNFSSREELDLFIKKLVIFSGRTSIKKINNVELSDIKGRVNIAYSPFGPQLTITRAKERPLSIIDLIKNGTLTAELAAQFWLYVEGLKIKPANILVAGGPGSGKTTLLNALFSFIPKNERMVVIEDTLELNTDLEENCSRLESDDELNLMDLVKNSLRMRPDRIIVGEVRGREAHDMMTAMNIGKYCMGTVHASTAREAIIRLTNEPMNVPELLMTLVDVIVVMRRYNLSNRQTQRVVGQLVETAGMESDERVLLSFLWSYNFAKSCFQESIVSSIYRDRLAELSGYTSKEVMDEISRRISLIKLLVEKNITDFPKVTEICRRYMDNPKIDLEELIKDFS